MLKIYNTLTREIEEFHPVEKNLVRMYSCGPTVYHYAHIGNLRAYINADILKRTLAADGYDVRHIINITDVGHLTSDEDTGEDKMEKGSRREGKSVWDIAALYTEAFMRDVAALNIIPPMEYTKATDFINEQIALVEKLEKLGLTYEIPGDGIYYDTSKFPDYGKLGGQRLDELKEGARIGITDGKRNASDFALWKFSPKDEQRQMEWESPWGTGFPGWHIECSAMSIARLGEHLDIHTGGEDHIKVHHTNEIAQSEPALGHKWCNYWVHTYFLNDTSGKMSKSAGGFLTLPVLMEKGFDPLDYRYFCLTASYRTQLAYSDSALASARAARLGLVNKIAALMEGQSRPDPVIVAAWHARLMASLNDDLNTAAALADLHSLMKDGNVDGASKLEIIKFADEVLGLRFLDEAASIRAKREVRPEGEVLRLVEERAAAKASKDFTRADAIRKELEAMGYELLDGKDGVKVLRRLD